jgi:tRNA-dihydrouridine synthase 4
MMLAHEFTRSPIARDSDFTTHTAERLPTIEPNGTSRPHILIAQFAASSPTDFARASSLIAPHVDGVNLNCGCPQSWAIKENLGCQLMEEPELVASMVRAAKSILAPLGKSVSVKIRIAKDLEKTKRWVDTVQAAGVDYITVHGRTRSQRSSTPPDYDAIALVKAHARVPIVANGDAYTLAGVQDIAARTGVDGVMAARGLLENPALFAGYDVTPVECVRLFLGYAIRCPIPYQLVQHHVCDMTAKMEGMGKKQKRALMECRDLLELVDWVDEKWGRGERVAPLEGGGGS